MIKVSVASILDFLKTESIECEYFGDGDVTIEGFSSLRNYKEGSVTWMKSQANALEGKLLSNVTLLIAQTGVVTDCSNVIVSPVSKRAFFAVLEEFFPSEQVIDVPRSHSLIADTASIGENVTMGYGCYVGNDVVIEDGVKLGNNVSIECRAHIGKNSIISSGVKIGGAGFGLTKDENGLNHRVKHYGGVWIGNDVEIGGNCVISSGTIDDTFIGNNVKIDSLIYIPHNVFIGDRCIIIGSMGGSCRIGEDSYIAPHTFVKNQIEVGKNCMVNSGVVLVDDLPDGMIVHKIQKNRLIKMNYRRILNL